MKPLGRKYYRCPTQSKTDYHIHQNGHKVENWWEEVCQPNKKSERQQIKKEISKYLLD